MTNGPISLNQKTPTELALGDYLYKITVISIASGGTNVTIGFRMPTWINCDARYRKLIGTKYEYAVATLRKSIADLVSELSSLLITEPHTDRPTQGFHAVYRTPNNTEAITLTLERYLEIWKSALSLSNQLYPSEKSDYLPLCNKAIESITYEMAKVRQWEAAAHASLTEMDTAVTDSPQPEIQQQNHKLSNVRDADSANDPAPPGSHPIDKIDKKTSNPEFKPNTGTADLVKKSEAEKLDDTEVTGAPLGIPKKHDASPWDDLKNTVSEKSIDHPILDIATMQMTDASTLPNQKQKIDAAKPVQPKELSLSVPVGTEKTLDELTKGQELQEKTQNGGIAELASEQKTNIDMKTGSTDTVGYDGPLN